MPGKLPKILLITAIFVVTAIVLSLTFGKKFIRESFFSSKGVDAEVLGWNSSNGTLKVRIQRSDGIFEKNVIVDPVATKVITNQIMKDKTGNEIARIIVITQKTDPLWEKAFCQGDIVRLVTDLYDITKDKLADTILVKVIQNTGPMACQKI